MRQLATDHPEDEKGLLVERLRRRDPQACVALYDLYGRVLFMVIERIVQKPSVVEGLVQETLLRAWNRSSELTGNSPSVGPWLVGIAGKCASDYVNLSRTAESHQETRPAESNVSRKASVGS
jgi:DNA-directed RNA polymerase specialized sigma24 family protein